MTIQPYHEEVRELIEQHRQFDDEPMVLALRYLPNGSDDNVYLLEVAENIALDMPDPDKRIYDIEYASTPGFPTNNGGRLHIALSSPTEFQTALKEHWPDAQRIEEAVRAGRYEIIYQRRDDVTKQLLGLLGCGVSA